MVQTRLTWRRMTFLSEAKTAPDIASHLGQLRLQVCKVAEDERTRRPILAIRRGKALDPLPGLFVVSEFAGSGSFDRPDCLVFLC